MLLSLLRSGFSAEAVIYILLMLPVIAISLTVHEYAHGFVALKCGDGTARAFGRLTFNPVKHLDPVGFISMLLVGFGWAKPVPVNIRSLRNTKRDIAFVSLAGPVSNLLLGFVSAFVFVFLTGVFWDKTYAPLAAKYMLLFGNYTFGAALSGAKYYILLLLWLSMVLNIGLAVFNLIPLPPLDGSKILSVLLPGKMAKGYLEVERYSRFVLLGLIALTWVGGLDIVFWPLDFLREKIAGLYLSVFRFLL